MKNANPTGHSDLSEFLRGEFALAPYRTALKFASMAHLGATAMIRMNRVMLDAYREAVRGQQDAFTKLSSGIVSRLAHDGVNPTETAGVMSQTLADIYRSAIERTAEFERTMASAREECFSELREQMDISNIIPSGGGEKKAA